MRGGPGSPLALSGPASMGLNASRLLELLPVTQPFGDPAASRHRAPWRPLSRGEPLLLPSPARQHGSGPVHDPLKSRAGGRDSTGCSLTKDSLRVRRPRGGDVRMIVFSTRFGCFFLPPRPRGAREELGTGSCCSPSTGAQRGRELAGGGQLGVLRVLSLERAPRLCWEGALGVQVARSPPWAQDHPASCSSMSPCPPCAAWPPPRAMGCSAPRGGARAASPSPCRALSRVVPVLLPSCAPIPGPPGLASCLAPGSGIRAASSRWGERPPSLSVCACVPCSVSRRKKK